METVPVSSILPISKELLQHPFQIVRCGLAGKTFTCLNMHKSLLMLKPLLGWKGVMQISESFFFFFPIFFPQIIKHAQSCRITHFKMLRLSCYFIPSLLVDLFLIAYYESTDVILVIILI